MGLIRHWTGAPGTGRAARTWAEADRAATQATSAMNGPRIILVLSKAGAEYSDGTVVRTDCPVSARADRRGLLHRASGVAYFTNGMIPVATRRCWGHESLECVDDSMD